MRRFQEIFNERSSEIRNHLKFLYLLDGAIVGRIQLTVSPLDLEHVNFIKSGFLVHLYNFVESVMDSILGDIASDVKQHAPGIWCDELLREWARGRVDIEKPSEHGSLVESIFHLLEEASGRNPIGKMKIKRSGGNWDCDSIKKMAERLGCELRISRC